MSACYIIGGWRGAYFYDRSPYRACVFHANFVLGQYHEEFTGTIMDETPIEGYGDMTAQVEGTVDGRTVRFTKSYMVGGLMRLLTGKLTYTGTISEDGARIDGRWELIGVFGLRTTGSWQAERTWPPLGAASEAPQPQ